MNFPSWMCLLLLLPLAIDPVDGFGVGLPRAVTLPGVRSHPPVISRVCPAGSFDPSPGRSTELVALSVGRRGIHDDDDDDDDDEKPISAFKPLEDDLDFLVLLAGAICLSVMVVGTDSKAAYVAKGAFPFALIYACRKDVELEFGSTVVTTLVLVNATILPQIGTVRASTVFWFTVLVTCVSWYIHTSWYLQTDKEMQTLFRGLLLLGLFEGFMILASYCST